MYTMSVPPFLGREFEDPLAFDKATLLLHVGRDLENLRMHDVHCKDLIFCCDDESGACQSTSCVREQMSARVADDILISLAP